MIFSSLLFLFQYLPIMLLCYFIVPRKFRNAVLFFGSLIFYAWGEPIYFVLMLFSTVVDFTHGQLIHKAKEAGDMAKAKKFLISAMVINLTLLGVFKYTDFIIRSINTLTGLSIAQLHLPLPIGISFYTFQTMSYSIDIYRGDAKLQKNIIDFGAYVTMFPQLIAGPIVRYQTVADELNHRRENADEFADGIALFMVGLGKKVMLANNIGMLWDTISALPVGELAAATAWLGAVAFGLQIYFDFAGYSDMARGMGLMMGFHFDLNFNYPYISRSITEFWRRWHISLGTWFKEYVYIPLGGNRGGIAKQIRNIAIVWLLTGIWHGANINFLLWGVYFGVLLIIEKMFILKHLKKAPAFVGWLYTMFLVLISWVIFASVDGAGGVGYMAAMFGGGGSLINGSTFYLLRNYGLILVLCLVGATPIPAKAANFVRRKLSVTVPAVAENTIGMIYTATEASTAATIGRAESDKMGDAVSQKQSAMIKIDGTSWQILWSIAAAALFVVCTAYLVDASYNPFLYFRF